MRGFFDGQDYGATPYAASPYYAASPFTYDGARATGAQVAAAAGNVVQTVAAPVVGFTQGVLQGRALLVVLAIGAVLLLSRDN